MSAKLFKAALASLVLATSTISVATAADAYDAAVKNPARSAEDVKRDALDHPADILRLTGIKPGMKVADILAGDGYYSELLSYVVGPQTPVLMVNDPAFDKWSAEGIAKRFANGRLPSVKHLTVPFTDMKLAPASLDAALLVKVYHDLYTVDEAGGWPKVDVPNVLDQIVRALKPGGVLLVVDHSAKAGTGKADAQTLHRIDEAFTRKDFEAHGLQLAGETQVLRRPDDKRDLLSYKGPGAGKTDRFVLLFKKK